MKILVAEREMPPHPYWCDECGNHSGFTIPGSEIEHSNNCSRFGEDAMEIYEAAKQYCLATGKSIT